MRALPRTITAGLLVAAIAGCDRPAATAPPPAALTTEAMGHYCGMQITQHAGPKGQIFVAGMSEPFWFSSVRDALAFTRLPEEPKAITAIYVNDMAVADWDQPADSSWIDARQAWYVVGSRRLGGMGRGELVPFGNREAAEAFVEQFGGQVRRFEQIPDDEILGDSGAPSL